MTTVNSVNTYITPTTSHEVTMPLQPCFLAWLDVSVLNVTGDSTEYTIIYDTEEFDVNADFNLGTSTFTAPVTGKYEFSVKYTIDFDGSTPNILIARIKPSNRVFRYIRSDSPWEPPNLTGWAGNIIVDMDAADTATTSIQYEASGKSIDVLADVGGEPVNWFCGTLLV